MIWGLDKGLAAIRQQSPGNPLEARAPLTMAIKHCTNSRVVQAADGAEVEISFGGDGKVTSQDVNKAASGSTRNRQMGAQRHRFPTIAVGPAVGGLRGKATTTAGPSTC